MASDLFNNDVKGRETLREQFGANPFSVFDVKDQAWKERKQWWNNKGILPPLEPLHSKSQANITDERLIKGASVFDPVLCELMYRWYCPEDGSIIDPFAGGAVRGIVANYLGRHYTGIDIRPEQVACDIDQVNNSVTKESSQNPIWKYAVKFLFWLENIFQTVAFFA